MQQTPQKKLGIKLQTRFPPPASPGEAEFTLGELFPRFSHYCEARANKPPVDRYFIFCWEAQIANGPRYRLPNGQYGNRLHNESAETMHTDFSSVLSKRRFVLPSVPKTSPLRCFAALVLARKRKSSPKRLVLIFFPPFISFDFFPAEVLRFSGFCPSRSVARHGGGRGGTTRDGERWEGSWIDKRADSCTTILHTSPQTYFTEGEKKKRGVVVF